MSTITKPPATYDRPSSRGDVTTSWNTGEVHRTYVNGRSRHFPATKPVNPPKQPKGSV